MGTALDVWFRFDTEDPDETEAEANTYQTDDGYRVEWYLTAVGLVTEVDLPTREGARQWLAEQGFVDFGSAGE